jgi:hypothetical protein
LIVDRKERNDILKQTGAFSTIVIQTEKVSFHVEYSKSGSDVDVTDEFCMVKLEGLPW